MEERTHELKQAFRFQKKLRDMDKVESKKVVTKKKFSHLVKREQLAMNYMLRQEFLDRIQAMKDGISVQDLRQ